MHTDRSHEITTEVEVVGKEAVAEGIVALTLKSVSGEALPSWSAGAHIDLHIGPGLVRQYSLCGQPNPTEWKIAVLRESQSRGGSAFVHDELSQGDKIEVRGPRNHFELKPADKYLFIAGGIGITPILPMIRNAEAANAEWRLMYGGRTETSMAFAQELVEEFGDRVSLHPQDRFGFLDLAGLVASCDEGTHIYSCGPGPLLEALEQQCVDMPHRLHIERFVPKVVQNDGALPEFDVILTQSNRTLRVTPDKTILETIEDAGIYVESSCRAGTCGTCEMAVLAGKPVHRDSLLDEDEREAGDTIMICVSRSAEPTLSLQL